MRKRSLPLVLSALALAFAPGTKALAPTSGDRVVKLPAPRLDGERSVEAALTRRHSLRFVGGFDDMRLSAALDLPSSVGPLAIMPIGAPLPGGGDAQARSFGVFSLAPARHGDAAKCLESLLSRGYRNPWSGTELAAFVAQSVYRGVLTMVREIRNVQLWACLVALVGLFLIPAGAGAYSQYSVNGDATNCRLCHGDFRASTYTSLSDGGSWPDGLHDTHRNTMLDGDCLTCHGAGPRFPVLLGSSSGGDGLDPISCAGCHGRFEDGTGTGSEGYGAGLRQHHWNNSVTLCVTCHSDADPGAFTPVEEDFLPVYYAASDPNHPNIPSDPCNPSGVGEDYAASSLGLDNDGDDLYDELDLIACPEPGMPMMMGSAIAFLSLLGRRRARR